MSHESQTSYDPRRELDKTTTIAIALVIVFFTGLVLTLTGLVG